MRATNPVRSLPRRMRATYDDLRSEGRGPILASVAVGWMLSLGVRLTLPAVLPRIRTAFGFDLTTAGLLLTVLWLSYAVAQFPGGLLADRIGEGNVLVASTGTAAVTIALMVAAPNAGLFIAGTALFGLGTGLYATTRFTVVPDVYPDRDGTAMGVTSAAGNLGSMTLPVVAGVLAGVVGWRAGLGLFVPLFVLVGVALRRFVPEVTSTTSDRGDVARTVRLVLGRVTDPAVLRGAGAMFFIEVIYQGFTGFYPTYLVVEKGLSGSVAAALFGGFFASAVVVQPLTGAASDRFGRRTVLVVATGIAAAALAALPFVGGLPALLVVTAGASAQMGFWPVAQSYVIGALPDEIQGSGFGLVRTAFLLVASLGPLLIGALADRGHFDEAMLLLSLAAVGAVALCLSLPPPAGRERPAPDE